MPSFSAWSRSQGLIPNILYNALEGITSLHMVGLIVECSKCSGWLGEGVYLQDPGLHCPLRR